MLMCSVTGEIEVVLGVGVTKKHESRTRPYSRRAAVHDAIKVLLHMVNVVVLG